MRIYPRPFGQALALGLVLVAAPLSAETVYKWTDDQGRTHYSDAPPASGQTQELDMAAPEPQAATPEEEGSSDQEAEGESEGESQEDLATKVQISQAENRVAKLRQEVARARRTYQEARDARIEGEKVRKGNEQNYVRYLERIEGLKEDEQAAKERLEDLRQRLEEARAKLEKLRNQAQSQQQGD